MRSITRLIFVMTVAVMGWSSIVVRAVEISAPVDISPKVEKTRFQKWPRAAWSSEANCWLVVWREGDLNEHETDIWCARVGVDGTTLDPEGIRITSAKDVQDRPVVVSDGKGFIVVWQDLRSGKDWDVYTTKVSADGKVLNPDGVLLSGGPHNQCLPSVAYAGENYYAVWQSWVVDGAVKGFGSYEVKGARISSDGKVLDPDGIPLVGATALQPVLASHKDGGLVLMAIGRNRKKMGANSFWFNTPGIINIDPQTGAAKGAVSFFERNKFVWDLNYVPGIMLAKDGTGLVTMNGWKGGMTLFRFDKNGKRIDDWQRFRENLRNQCIAPMSSIALNGERVLLTYDFPSATKKIGKRPVRMKVWGWIYSADGKMIEGGKSGFSIAADKKTDCMQAVPCAGPEGLFLVVYAEARAIENTKVVARLVK